MTGCPGKHGVFKGAFISWFFLQQFSDVVNPHDMEPHEIQQRFLFTLSSPWLFGGPHLSGSTYGYFPAYVIGINLVVQIFCMYLCPTMQSRITTIGYTSWDSPHPSSKWQVKVLWGSQTKKMSNVIILVVTVAGWGSASHKKCVYIYTHTSHIHYMSMIES